MNVRAAVDLAAGTGRAGFEAELDRAGILYRANVASTGRVNGYSFADPNRLDSDGQPVWFTASKLDRGLSWSKVSTTLDGPPKHQPAPVQVEPCKRLESAQSHQRRTEAARTAADQSGRNRYRHERAGALVAERAQHARFWSTQPVAASKPIAEAAENRRTAEQAASGPLGAPPESSAARAARLARRGVTQANPSKSLVKKTPVEPSHQDRERRAAQKPQDPRRGISR